MILRDDQIEMLHERRTVGFSEGVGDVERGNGLCGCTLGVVGVAVGDV